MNTFYHGVNCMYYCCSDDQNRELNERLLDQNQFQNEPAIGNNNIDVDNVLLSYGDIMRLQKNVM